MRADGLNREDALVMIHNPDAMRRLERLVHGVRAEWMAGRLLNTSIFVKSTRGTMTPAVRSARRHPAANTAHPSISLIMNCRRGNGFAFRIEKTLRLQSTDRFFAGLKRLSCEACPLPQLSSVAMLLRR